MVMDVVIRPASDEDADALGVIGPASYAAAYHDIWTDASAFVKQLMTFNAATFRDFMCRDGATVLIAEKNGIPIGFLMLTLGETDPIVHAPLGVEISRLYLLPCGQHKGIGRKLYEAACTLARQAKMKYVWLDVMASARQAIKAYERWGFISIGESRFPYPVRQGHSGMLVMKASLSV